MSLVAGANSKANSAAPSVTVPATCTVGDVLLVHLSQNAADAITAEPAGLSTVASDASVATFPNKLYVAVVDGTTITAGGVLNWTLSATRAWSLVLEARRGINTTTPILASATPSHAATSPPVMPNLTTTATAEIVEVVSGKSNGTLITGYTAPSGWTIDQTAASATTFGGAAAMASKGTASPAGTYGGETYTPSSATGAYVGFLIALNPTSVVLAPAGTATADGQAPVVTVSTVVSGGGPGTATAAGIAPTLSLDPSSVMVIPTPVVYLNSSRASLGSLNFGMVEPSGVAWVLQKVQGWGSPASTMQVTQKPRSHGGWAGPGYLPARVVTLSGTVDAPTTDLLTDALDRLSEACSLDDTTLAMVEASRVRTMLVRRQGEVLTDAISDLAANWSVQVVALDPRKYGALTSQLTTLPSSSGGRTWPATWPAVWSGVANSGTVTIRNEGNIATPVVIRIDGPVVAPSVTRISETGDTKVLAFSLTLAAGEYLLINTDPSKRSVLANGQSSRSGYLTSRGWFLAEKGVNTYGFNAQVFNSTAQMTVTVPTGAWS